MTHRSDGTRLWAGPETKACGTDRGPGFALGSSFLLLSVYDMMAVHGVVGWCEAYCWALPHSLTRQMRTVCGRVRRPSMQGRAYWPKRPGLWRWRRA